MNKIRLTIMFTAIMATMMAFVSCDNEEKPRRRINPDMKLVINVKDAQMRTKGIEDADTGGEVRPTVKEMIQQATRIAYNPPGQPGPRGQAVGGIMDDQKDLINEKIKFPSYYIIDKIHPTIEDEEPYLVESLIKATNVRILSTGQNVVGYIPQSVLKAAYEKIKVAWDKKDYDTVYKLFEEAYVAYPCTTKEWEELKAQGKN